MPDATLAFHSYPNATLTIKMKRKNLALSSLHYSHYPKIVVAFA